MFTEKHLKILERAAAVETRARNLEVRFEFIENGIQPVFPELVLNQLIATFSMSSEEQDRWLVKFDHATLLVLAELDGDFYEND